MAEDRTELVADTPASESTPANPLRAALEEAYTASEEKTETVSSGVDQAPSEESETTAQSQDVAAALEPPEMWSAESKEAFRKAPAEVQQALLKQHEANSADYTRKTQEIAEAKREVEEYNQFVAPHKDRLALAGMSPSAALNQLMTVQKMLDENPVETLRWMAKSYGLNFQTLAQQEQQAASGRVDPAAQIKALLDQELAPYREMMSQSQAAQQSFQQAALERDLQSFASETGEDGKPLRPHFTELLPAIEGILLRMKNSGEMPNGSHREIVQAAYEEAYKPLRKVMSDQITQKIEKAKAAKAAGSSVSGSPSGVSQPVKPKGIRATLEQAWEQHSR